MDGYVFPHDNREINITDLENIDDLPYDVPVGIIILLSFFYGGISILAVIGNSLVIWIVATTKHMQTVTNLFIANLALADVVIGMFAIPFQFQAALLQRWVLPNFMCAFCPFVQFISVNVSVFTLSAIAVDRYKAIINPFRRRPSRLLSKIIICSIWIVSACISAPIAYALGVTTTTDYLIMQDGKVIGYLKPFCDNVNLDAHAMKQYRYYLVFIQYVVPLSLIGFAYIQMTARLWGSKTPGNAQNARDITLTRNKKKVIKMLIIVVLIFGVCWLPLQLYNILQVTWESVNEYRYINIVWFVCDWLAMSNSCYNPFIYGIYNEKFKREFNKRFPIFRNRFGQVERSEKTVSTYTRANSISNQERINLEETHGNDNTSKDYHERVIVCQEVINCECVTINNFYQKGLSNTNFINNKFQLFNLTSNTLSNEKCFKCITKNTKTVEFSKNAAENELKSSRDHMNYENYCGKDMYNNDD